MDQVEAGGWLLLIIVGLLLIILIKQRWFWAVVFFFGSILAAFAMIASIIHFQLFEALGFFILMCGSFVTCALIDDGKYQAALDAKKKN